MDGTMDTGIRICAGCGEEFTPARDDQRCCSVGCRKRAERARKRDTSGGQVHRFGKSVTCTPDHAVSAGNDIPEATVVASVFGEALHAAWILEGLFEVRDMDGLPVFFDGGSGQRLYRVWGPGDISKVQLRGMTPPLVRTELSFPGGTFCVAIGGDR